ncbi:MAG: hypothetical protein ACRCYU_16095 [Nocardioides sp.]
MLSSDLILLPATRAASAAKSVAASAAESAAESEPLIHPYLVGAGALGVLLLALVALLAFGAGREHS